MKILSILIVSLVFPSALFADDSTKVRIVTYKSNPVHCLAAIAIRQVDGHQRQLPTMGFELEPGEHSMHGLATADLRNCTPIKSSRRSSVHIPPLEWFFEPGRVYYVALDYSSPNRENWRLVVWKTEYEDGEVIFDITKNDSKQFN